ncbi:hypothetical protein A0H76_1039 [Hepatospora eriocheir]|uniref:Uncharacterized protein n=1 Tax=Hepatospora eriocheir TaxID=1081669 RepID=A0A1X0QI43_9MICR|nr:hypothetical protein A0H76_1039 [Hepatospora eriocheir]
MSEYISSQNKSNDYSKELPFFHRFSKGTYIRENNQIELVEFNTQGNFISYKIDDSLKILNFNDFSINNFITVKMNCYKFFQENTLLHSLNNEIFYLSVYTNDYTAKFDCKSPISAISVDSYNDLFMASCVNNFNIFDIRYQNPTLIFKDFSEDSIGSINTDKKCVIMDYNQLRIYDFRQPIKPVIKKNINVNGLISNVKYTPDNDKIILQSQFFYKCLDTQGNLLNTITFENPNSADVTPYSTELICCSGNYLHAYKIKDGNKLDTIDIGSNKYHTLLHDPSGSSAIVLAADNLLTSFIY